MQEPLEEDSRKIRNAVEINPRKQKIIVSLWLDEYDNFFSDFDPRPYSQRSLSDDFLYEIKKITRETKPGSFDVTFLMPRDKRNKSMENVIRKRLHSFFSKQYDKLNLDAKKQRNKGILLAILGFSLMICSALAIEIQQAVFFIKYMRVILDPSGWFCAWYGLDHIFYLSRQNAPEIEFNKRMTRAEFRFDAY